MTNSFSFIHTSDLHLDSPFKGISSYNNDLGNICKESTFKAFNNIVNQAIQKKVDFVLIAGDIFDSATSSLRAQYEFCEGLKKLNNMHIHAYVVHGNHDPASNWEGLFGVPPLTTIFSSHEVERIEASNKNDDPVAVIHGMSFKDKAVTENMIYKFNHKDGDLFHIGILHCSVGDDPDHSPYAPCSMDDLKRLGYDYWALGHIHKPMVLHELYPKALYCGTPQGRSSKEYGEHGCYYIEVNNNHICNCEFIPVDVVRWVDISIDISDVQDAENLTEFYDALDNEFEILRTSYIDKEALVVNLSINGRSDLHKLLANHQNAIFENINNKANESGLLPYIHVTKLNLLSRQPVDVQELMQNQDFTGYILRMLEQAKTDDGLFHELYDNSNDVIYYLNSKNLLDEEMINENLIRQTIDEVQKLCVDSFEV
jgi:DNA repair exonuclease SbcCD nuclease subunit